MVGNAFDAEDVVQEAFTGAFRGLGGFQGRSSVKTWLTRILMTQAARSRRSKSRRRPEVNQDAVDASEVPPSAAAGVKMDLHAALAKLSDEHRRILLLREFDGMSYDELAQTLDVPRGTVESRLHRARAELREKLKAYLP